IRLSFDSMLNSLVDFAETRLGRSSQLPVQPQRLSRAVQLARAGSLITPWQFFFALSGGEAQMVEDLKQLTSFELFTLYVISAATRVTGLLQFSLPKAQSLLASASVAWVEDELRKSSFRHMIEGLSARKSNGRRWLLLYRDANHESRVSCLHYNIARLVVREVSSRADLGIVPATIAMLRSEISSARYFGGLLKDLNPMLLDLYECDPELFTRFVDEAGFNELISVGILLQLFEDYLPDSRAEAVIGRLNL